MFLGLLTLLTALTISSVAVYYSVSGLAAIFAGAYYPIIIMGTALEVGKLVTASWLHTNWRKAPTILKSYLVLSVVILMIITSLGIFGFLSRAHIDQGAPVGDVTAQIELLDEKISAKRAEIEQAKTALKNLDDVVAQFLLKGKDEKSVAAANNARKNQQVERNKTSKVIDDAQKEISKIQEQKLPLTKQVRQIETEVGPIKYIAAFMYGNNPGQDLLEKAVTWMIITIIFVFDPLAVLLLIASQMSFEQFRNRRAEKKIAKQETVTPSEVSLPEVIQPVLPEASSQAEIDEKTKIEEEKLKDVFKRLDEKALDFSRSVTEAIVEPTSTVLPKKTRKPKEVKEVENTSIAVSVPVEIPVEEIEEPKKKKKYMMKKNQEQMVLPTK